MVFPLFTFANYIRPVDKRYELHPLYGIINVWRILHMMGKQSGQQEMIFIDMESMIPKNHLLRRIEKLVDFSFIYDKASEYYAEKGRPSADPVLLIKMLLIGYLYGIKSERRLEQEVNLNIAYRWFCGLRLSDRVPDHSTFSQNRRRRFRDGCFIKTIFVEIVKLCVDNNLVDGQCVVCDGTFLPSEVSAKSGIIIEQVIEKSMQSYLDELDKELTMQPGYKEVQPRPKVVSNHTSKTDPECGFMRKRKDAGLGYLAETTVDCKHGIITGMDVYPANTKESSIVLRHLKDQMLDGQFAIKRLALDGGYDIGAVHRGLELLGIEGYIPSIPYSNGPVQHGFKYQPENDCFICPQGQSLYYDKLYCIRSTGNYLRCYLSSIDACNNCPKRESCLGKEKRRRILASSFYPAFFRGHERAESQIYDWIMRKRAIWAEGTFSVLKREHNLHIIRKRGLLRAKEEGLLAAIALNLKRMTKAVFDGAPSLISYLTHMILGNRQPTIQVCAVKI